MRVDLHIHSNNSDGTDSVEQIIDSAVAKGLEVIAITDHDNVNGLSRANEYAEGKIALINGMELSTFYAEADNLEIHVLGYGLDYRSETLLAKTHELLDKRVERIKKILANLRRENMYVGESELDLTCAGRLQIAKIMVKRGYVHSISEAFDRYLGSAGSCFEPSNRIATLEGVEFLKSEGATPVLAHPEKYLKAGILEHLLDELLARGLGGMECYYPSHSSDVTRKLLAMASERNLIATVGCDYHGKGVSNPLGVLNTEMKRSDIEVLMGHEF